MSNDKNDTTISERKLITKVKSSLRLVGREAVSHAFILYYTLRAPETPVWCRTVIIGSLSYFISMIDGIPDLTPFLGYTDDIAVMAAAIATLSSYITPEIKSKADEKTGQLLGE